MKEKNTESQNTPGEEPPVKKTSSEQDTGHRNSTSTFPENEPGESRKGAENRERSGNKSISTGEQTLGIP